MRNVLKSWRKGGWRCALGLHDWAWEPEQTEPQCIKCEMPVTGWP